MGEVYEAEDTRSQRSVALKILPEDVAFDPDPQAAFPARGSGAGVDESLDIVGIHSMTLAEPIF